MGSFLEGYQAGNNRLIKNFSHELTPISTNFFSLLFVSIREFRSSHHKFSITNGAN